MRGCSSGTTAGWRRRRLRRTVTPTCGTRAPRIRRNPPLHLAQLSMLKAKFQALIHSIHEVIDLTQPAEAGVGPEEPYAVGGPEDVSGDSGPRILLIEGKRGGCGAAA